MKWDIIILIYIRTTNEVLGCLRSPRPYRQEGHQYGLFYQAAKDLKSLLDSVQSHASEDDINKVIAAVKGKPIHQLINDGQSRLGSSAPVAASAAKVAEKKEAPKK